MVLIVQFAARVGLRFRACFVQRVDQPFNAMVLRESTKRRDADYREHVDAEIRLAKCSPLRSISSTCTMRTPVTGFAARTAEQH